LAKNDDLLIKSQQGAWGGYLNYWKTNGTKSDFYGKPDWWGRCFVNETADLHCGDSPYAEFSEGKMAYVGDVYSFEPCNYVSNVAYYHAVTKICDYPDWSVSAEDVTNIKRMYATLAAGSAFMHDSHTYVGYSIDVNGIGFIAF